VTGTSVGEDQPTGEPVRAPLSLEERLRSVRECCGLMADLFNIQAELAFLSCEVALSQDACNFLNSVCRAAADDLERLVRELPPGLANWHRKAPE
jgi:hypothetical protein